MSKEIKPSNFTFREQFKAHNYLSPVMIEELLDKVDDLTREVKRSVELRPTWQSHYAR
jgi:hypothetical protein